MKNQQTFSGLLGVVVLPIVVASLLSFLLTPLLGKIDLANIVMLFLLSTFLIALANGRTSSSISAIVNVGYFDYFFVSPLYSFNVDDAQYLITFSVMIIVGLVTGQLVSGLKEKVNDISSRASIINVLQNTSQTLISRSTDLNLIEESISLLAGPLSVSVLFYKCKNKKELDPQLHLHDEVANVLFTSQKEVFQDFGQYQYSRILMPILVQGQVIGILSATDVAKSLTIFGRDEALRTFSHLISIALSQQSLQQSAKSREIEAEGEKLKTAILTSLSHDLRTPLTTMLGLAQLLRQKSSSQTEGFNTILDQIIQQGHRLTHMVSNLLELVKFQHKERTMNKAWQPIDEVLELSLRSFRESHPAREVQVSMPEDVPAICIDDVLMERVLCNLLENAAKFSDPDSMIQIQIQNDSRYLKISVVDQGCGFLSDPNQFFQIFVRGDSGKKSGFGLGLFISKTIVEAHEGTIFAENISPQIGARVTISLPILEQPNISSSVPFIHPLAANQ